MQHSVQAPEAQASTTDEAPARAAADPLGSARAILELQSVAGNRAVGELIARRRAAIARDPAGGTAEKEAPKEEKSPWKPPKLSGPTSQKEFAYKIKIGTNKSFSFKLTFARTKNTKVVKTGVEGETFKGSLSLWEMKAVRE
jgi:hypothetical protein